MLSAPLKLPHSQALPEVKRDKQLSVINAADSFPFQADLDRQSIIPILRCADCTHFEHFWRPESVVNVPTNASNFPPSVFLPRFMLNRLSVTGMLCSSVADSSAVRQQYIANMANMTMRMQVKAPVVCAGAHASLRVQRARPMRLSAFQGFVAPARLSANCNLFATQQSFAGLVNAQSRTPSSRSLRTVICMAAKKSVSDLKKADLEGKVVLVRADLNVPLDKNQKITDDTRIRAAIPTLKYLTDNGAKVLLTSHLVGLGV